MYQYCYLNELGNHSKNLNKYVYFDSYDAVVEMKNNSWNYDINLYVVYDGILPSDAILCNLQTTFVNAKDIQTTYYPQTHIPYWVKEKQLCHTYNINFNIPFENKELIVNEIPNLVTDISLSIELNPHAVYDSIDKNSLIFAENEISGQKLTTQFNYRNCENFKNNGGWFQENNKFYINSLNDAYCLGQMVNIDFITQKKETNINKMWKISFDNSIFLTEIQNEFTICVDEKAPQILKESAAVSLSGKTFDIAILNNYAYNPKTKLVEKIGNTAGKLNILDKGTIEVKTKVKYLDKNNLPRWINLVTDYSYNGKNSSIEIKTKKINLSDINDFKEKIYE
ncbi:MAG: hypothetical protein LBB39_03430 [Mycoplasmataceae bacterium]|nr:hypothetical protein [Mycoplasmataceae bacterium]